MVAKLTAKNQLTLPKSVLANHPDAEFFDVSDDNGCIVLTPVRMMKADAVRSNLAEMGITGDDVADAVGWARKTRLQAGKS